MKFNLKTGSVGLMAIALIGAGVVVNVAPASAYNGTPPWVAGDQYNKGGLSFFDASGAVISGGSNLNNLGAYIGASTAPRATAIKASLILALPSSTNSIPSTWYNQSLQGSTTFSPAPAGTPAAVNNGNPFVKTSLGATDVSDGITGGTPDTSSPSYTNVFELRMQDTGPSTPSDGGKYWAADIEYNPSNATSNYDGLAPGAWRQIYPVVVTKTATAVSTPVASIASPAPHGSTINLTANITAADSTNQSGTVTFYDGATNLGTATTFDSASGSAGMAGLTPSDGNHSYTARFVPTNAATYSGATSGSLAYSVTARPIVGTSVSTLTSSTATPAAHGATTNLSVNVVATDQSVPAGAVEYFDGSTDIGAASFNATTGVATFSTAALVDGSHSFTATFTPADPTAYGSSTSLPLSFTVNPPPFTLPVPAVITNASILGTARVGSSLTCNAGVWTYAGTYAYQWFVNTSLIPFSSSLTSGALPASYAGHLIKCIVVATNPSGTASSTSAAAVIAAGPASVATARAKIVGVAKVGRTLLVYRGVWAPAPTSYTYTWMRAGAIVSHADRYKTTARDKGKALVVLVYAHRSGYLTGVSTSVAVKVG